MVVGVPGLLSFSFSALLPPTTKLVVVSSKQKMVFYPATGELLFHRHHHHQHHHLPFPPVRSRSPLPRRWLPFSRRRLGEILTMRETLTVTLRSVQCLRSDGGDSEVVDWVNSAARDPMVEVDPVTVFRRIVAERHARLAMAVAEEEAALLVQTTSPPPFFPSSKQPSNLAIAIATALVILALAAALYFFRSRKNSDDGSKLTGTDGNDALGPFLEGRRKVDKDTIKPSQSILTAMKIGAASLGRYTDPSHGSSHAVHGNAAVDQILKVKGETDLTLISNIVAIEETESDSSSLQQTLSFAPFKGQNVGVDVTEGPWFGQPAVETHEPFPAEKEKLEYEAVLVQSQGCQFANETVTLQSDDQCVGRIPVSKVLTEPLALTNDPDVVDGEFFGEVVSVNIASDEGNSSYSVDQTVETIRLQELGDILDDEGLTKDSLQMGRAKQGDVIDGHPFDLVSETGEEQLTEFNVSLSQMDHQDSGSPLEKDKSNHRNTSKSQSYGNIPAQPSPDIGNLLPALEADCSVSESAAEATGKVSKRDSSKALEAAVPALAIGVGTVGTLLGVAGGLQVVGFAALASLISREFLWAQSRDSFWQELSGITDRQKLLDFLAKRNIMIKK